MDFVLNFFLDIVVHKTNCSRVFLDVQNEKKKRKRHQSHKHKKKKEINEIDHMNTLIEE